MNEPSSSDWTALYQAAIALKQASPWNWMGNEHLFAVENPDNGEVGYCVVLGSGGEEFGLGIFAGEDGCDRYMKTIEGEKDPEDFEESVMARLISMLFVDRDDLHKKDREVIRFLGLRFRGGNEWPVFRSQLPGHVPSFLEKEEVLFLTTAIYQALVVVNRVQNGELDLWEKGRGNIVLTRCCRGGNWVEEWRSPLRLSDREQETNTENIDPLKEAELHLLHGRTGGLSGRWELDIFILPIPIGAMRDRPYFPSCFLAVESIQGLIIDANLTKPWLTLSEKQDEVIQILRKGNQLPSEIRVRSDKVGQIVEPITSILGIKLRVGSLSMLEQAKDSLYQRFSGRGG